MPQQQSEYAPVPSMQPAGQIRGQIRGQLSGVFQQQIPPQYYADTQQQQPYLSHSGGDQSKGMHTERSESLLLFVVAILY